MKRIFLPLLTIAIIGVAGYFIFGERNTTYEVSNIISNGSTSAPITPGSKEYSSSKYNFSVKLPEGFSAREISSAELGDGSQSESIVFENGKGEGIQIVVTPFDDIKVLTADMIKADIPDMKIEQVQTVDVGQNYKGIAFISNASEFDGASREVWFVFKGNLYQISTYTKFDALLQSIFSTWQFK
jgi:hypothetical protein